MTTHYPLHTLSVCLTLFGLSFDLLGLRFRVKFTVAEKMADTQGCYHPKVTHIYTCTHTHMPARTNKDRPPQKRKITTMGNLPRTGRDDGQGTDACTHKHTHGHKRTHIHTAVPQGQGSGNASLPSLGGNSISQHAFLMWRGNYPWAVLRANRVCPPICLSPSSLSFSLNPSLTLWLCPSRPCCPPSLGLSPSHPVTNPFFYRSLFFFHCHLIFFPLLCPLFLSDVERLITKDKKRTDWLSLLLLFIPSVFQSSSCSWWG